MEITIKFTTSDKATAYDNAKEICRILDDIDCIEATFSTNTIMPIRDKSGKRIGSMTYLKGD